MTRLRLDIAYDGGGFNGWAAQHGQANVRTVQSTLENVISTVFRQECVLTVAGRTDAGVHASGQVAHVDVPTHILSTRSIAGDVSQLVRRFTRLLPADIRVHAVREVPTSFDARFSALRRHYVYRVTTAPAGPLPTRRTDTAWWPKQVDLSRMQEGAQKLLGLNDFAAFSKYREGATTVRDLQRFDWVDISTADEPQTFAAYVSADAFTWSMVRSLVGASLMIGEGRRTPDFMDEMLTRRERAQEIPVAPACGLTLIGVDYPDENDYAARAEQTRGIRVLDGEEERARGKGCPETNPHY